MEHSVKNGLFLLKKDLFAAFRQRRPHVLAWAGALFVGVALGIYIGVYVGEKEQPFGVFAALFNLEFAPFHYLVPDFLRFLLFSLLVFAAIFLPPAPLYPALALFFFGKHFGEISCVCFQSDSLPSALLSILLVYLPLLLFGGLLLIYLAQRAMGNKNRSIGVFCPQAIRGEALLWLKIHLLYFAVLFLLYVVLCGALYLFAIAL